MSKRFVAVLALLVVALGGYIALFERGSLTSKQLDERKGKVLRTFVRDQVTRLSLERGGVKLVLERKLEDDGNYSQWKLVAPMVTPADQDAVDKLLGELEWLSPRRILEDVSPADREKLGLNKPRFRFGYRVANVDYTAELGAEDVRGDSYYLGLGGDKAVYVVPKTLVEALDHDLGHFRAKEFLGDITSAWAQRVILQQDGKTITLQKEGERWWVQNPPKGWGDAQRVQQLVSGLDSLRALRFVEQANVEGARAQLANASLRIELHVIPDTHREDKEAQRFVLRVAGPCKGHEGERYAQAGDKGDPVCIREEDAERLGAGEDELRALRLLGVDTSEIERIELSAGGKSWKLKRDGEKWLGEGLPNVDREAVEAWLRDLSLERATGVTSALEKPQGTLLTLSLASKQTQKLTAVSAADHVLVQREGEPVALRFGPSLADQLAPFERRLTSLVLWPELQPSQVSSVSAQAGKLARKLELAGSAWRAGAKPLAADDENRARELVRDVVKLSAISIVAEKARSDHGLDAPTEIVTLGVAGGKTLQLELGATTARGAYARVDKAFVVLLGADAKALVTELAGGARAIVPQAAADDEEDEGDHDHHE